MTNPVQPVNPIGAPPPVTPADTPSYPAGYAEVTPRGRGPAPYDIQAPQPDLGAVFAEAGRLSGGHENDIYADGLRQQQAAALLESPAGFGLGGFDVDAGWSGGGGDSGWPANPEPSGM